jgi:hypothetical protein
LLSIPERELASMHDIRTVFIRFMFLLLKMRIFLIDNYYLAGTIGFISSKSYKKSARPKVSAEKCTEFLG